MRVQEVHTKTFLNYKKAQRLVKKGKAAWVNDDRRQVRYLEGYEQMLLGEDMQQAAAHARYEDMRQAVADASYDRVINEERGGTVTGDWQPKHSLESRRRWGGPQCKTMQFHMTVRNG